VHVANEFRSSYPGAEVEVRAGPDVHSRFAGDVTADSVSYVGRVDIPARAAVVDVVLRQSDLGEIANRYGPVLLQAARPVPGS
jgi:hypothetical protein